MESPNLLPGEILDASKRLGYWLLARMGKRVLQPGGIELTKRLRNHFTNFLTSNNEKRKMRKDCFTLLLIIAATFCCAPCDAHFPFLTTDDDGHATMWFGTSIDDQTYPMPENIQSIELSSQNIEKPVATSPVDSDSLVGIRSQAPIELNAEIFGTTTYGLYHGTKLTYHVEHLPQSDPKTWPTEPRSESALQTTIRPTDEGIEVHVFKGKEPLADTDVKLFRDESSESVEQTTDAAGSVRFAANALQAGLNVVMVGIQDDKATGTYEDEDYSSTTDYLTSTFFYNNESNEPKSSEWMSATISSSGLADLPVELTSFGAAIVDGKVYVYGGHTGSAHSYSTAEQSNQLWCLDLEEKNATWKQLTGGPRLQGLGMVAHDGRIIRLGGFTAMNEEDEDHDLQSQAKVAAYDPATDTWTDLSPLPEPRSSFDAAVIGDTVYVVGGWQLKGDSDESVWHKTAWKLDLSNPNGIWQPLAAPPFQRRAVSVAAHQEKLYVIGGMQSNDETTTEVAVYDPAKDRWNKGPSLPGESMDGFGTAAFQVGGRLVATTMSGNVFQLSNDASKWNPIAKLDPGRFFHRLVPISDDQLLVVGGANMGIGKFAVIERIDL
ncbi:N-acetylneuraminate epimerase precursor [Novipirellula aureliae]|uniref:N-acetylneuraminate epimerase n=1 Tax=Novipirellula aureliae TaxID=2527966 RepID=A0A5C6DG85_9BACT|nr:hypothetical protein [Novipirellula aureliae]TWU35738.1 N-acetylneuraminate epimerase precursor [Novipirellula aureliae]